MSFVEVGGRRLEYELVRPDPQAPVIVFLHEGLGSLSAWRDFPARAGQATGYGILVYSRYGHGRSDPLAGPRRPDFMHDEAQNALPGLLDALEVARPVLLGHSDGASIALIHAASGREVAAVIAMAPHVMVEEVSIRSIREAGRAYETTDLREKLARHHASADAMFRGWNDIWLAPEFRDWSIEDCLPRIACPVLAIQGEGDEYGTMRQIERIAEAAADVQLVKLAGCGHSPHRDRPDAVIEAVTTFIARRPAAPRGTAGTAPSRRR